MKQAYFDQLGDVYKKMQKPLQELTELNLKVLEEFKSTKLDELFDVKKHGP